MTPPVDPPQVGNGKPPEETYENPYPFQRRAVSEATPLLAAATNSPFSYHRASSPDETLRDDELEEREIEPNDFDYMLRRATSYTSGLGIEPESQESSMLRGPRKYSRRGSRRVSSTSAGRRRTGGSPSGLEEEAVIEEDIEESDESPYLGGVSVRRFWLIYAGLLSNLVMSYSMLLFVLC
jgi:hypothetical protein